MTCKPGCLSKIRAISTPIPRVVPVTTARVALIAAAAMFAWRNRVMSHRPAAEIEELMSQLGFLAPAESVRQLLAFECGIRNFKRFLHFIWYNIRFLHLLPD